MVNKFDEGQTIILFTGEGSGQFCCTINFGCFSIIGLLMKLFLQPNYHQPDNDM